MTGHRELHCEIHPFRSLDPLRFVVICSFYKGRMLLSFHSGHQSWETQGGHIEQGELPEEAALRELYEESGVKDVTLIPVCDYHASDSEGSSNGRVYAGIIHQLGKLPDNEMSKVQLFDDFPENLTYPFVTPVLFQEAREKTKVSIRQVTIEDYDAIFELWNSTEQSRRALNPVDDSREGIARYLERNPNTCFAAVIGDRIVGVILTGHDGRRGIIHHMCVHPDYRRMGIAAHLVSLAEEALKNEGIQKVFGLVFTNNETANLFWEKQGYSLRTNLNYRNKSLNPQVPTGE